MMTMLHAASRPVRALFLAGLALAGCGHAAASPGSANEPTSGTEAPDTAVVDQGPVLVLGRAFTAGQIEIGADGTIGGGVLGRMDADGTLRRADGTVCAHIARDGTFHIEPPSRLHDIQTFRIEGDTLIALHAEHAPEVVATVVDGGLALDGRPVAIAGLTPEYHRTVLAAFALMLIAMEESGPMQMF
jgi:hypothetical protein